MIDYDTHPLANIIPSMMMDEVAELEHDIKIRGVINSITLYDGQILDGRHRYAIATKHNIPFTVTTFTGTEAAARAHVLSLNVHRRHLTFEQKQKLVEAELKRNPGQSDRMIATATKVSRPTVAKVRASLEDSGQLAAAASSIGKDGKERPRHVAATHPKLVSVAALGFDVDIDHARPAPIPVTAEGQPLRNHLSFKVWNGLRRHASLPVRSPKLGVLASVAPRHDLRAVLPGRACRPLPTAYLVVKLRQL